MSLNHKRVDRIGDEYSCARCGKSWSIDDTDPPACVAVVAIAGAGTRTRRTGPNPERGNVPKVSNGNDMTPEQMRGVVNADFAEREARVNADISSGRRVSMPPSMAYPYGSAFRPYVVAAQHPVTQAWIGAVVYAKDPAQAVEYLTRVYANNTTTYGEKAKVSTDVLDRLCVDSILGYGPSRNHNAPWAEMNPTTLSMLQRHTTTTKIKYELYNPLKFITEVNKV